MTVAPSNICRDAGAFAGDRTVLKSYNRILASFTFFEDYTEVLRRHADCICSALRISIAIDLRRITTNSVRLLQATRLQTTPCLSDLSAASTSRLFLLELLTEQSQSSGSRCSWADAYAERFSTSSEEKDNEADRSKDIASQSGRRGSEIKRWQYGTLHNYARREPCSKACDSIRRRRDLRYQQGRGDPARQRVRT